MFKRARAKDPGPGTCEFRELGVLNAYEYSLCLSQTTREDCFGGKATADPEDMDGKFNFFFFLQITLPWGWFRGRNNECGWNVSSDVENGSGSRI